MVRNIFIDESARDVEDDWEEEQDEEDNDGEELNERVSVNQTSSLLRIRSEAVCVADGGTPHDQANIASGEITRPFATSIASKSAPSSHGPSFGRPGSSEASSSSLRTIELVQSKAPALSIAPPFCTPSTPVSLQRVARTSETGQWQCKHRSLEWTRIQSGTYRNDIGLIVDVAENVATTYVVPRIGDPDAPRRRGSKRFFTSKEVRRYVRSGRDFTYENSLGFDRWTLGRGHTRIFKCGFEVLSLKTGYSGPGELPTVEEFQLFYTNHCPHLDTQEGLELLERTARLLLPPISPREHCEIVGGPLFGSVCQAIWWRPGLVSTWALWHSSSMSRMQTVTALDVESCSEVTFLKDFLVFHNEAFTPMGDDAHRWLSVGHINRAPNGVQIGDMCEVIRGPEAGAKGRLIDKIGRPSSVAYDSYRMTYGLELDGRRQGNKGIGGGRWPVYKIHWLPGHCDWYPPFEGFTRMVASSGQWMSLCASSTILLYFQKLPTSSMLTKSGVYCSTSRKWVKLEDAIRPNRRGITMVYEKEGAPQRPLMRARTPPAPPLPSQYLGSVWDPDPQKTNGCELSKWIEWFPALASALPTPGLLVKLEAPFIMFHGNPNVWRIMKLNGSAAPSLVYGVEGVFSFPIEHPTEVPPDRMLPLRPSEVQRPYEALVVHRRHEFFGRVVLVKPCDSPHRNMRQGPLECGRDTIEITLHGEDATAFPIGKECVYSPDLMERVFGDGQPPAAPMKRCTRCASLTLTALIFCQGDWGGGGGKRDVMWFEDTDKTRLPSKSGTSSSSASLKAEEWKKKGGYIDLYVQIEGRFSGNGCRILLGHPDNNVPLDVGYKDPGLIPVLQLSRAADNSDGTQDPLVSARHTRFGSWQPHRLVIGRFTYPRTPECDPNTFTLSSSGAHREHQPAPTNSSSLLTTLPLLPHQFKRELAQVFPLDLQSSNSPVQPYIWLLPSAYQTLSPPPWSPNFPVMADTITRRGMHRWCETCAPQYDGVPKVISATILKPDHHTDDSYDFDDIHDAVIYILSSGTAYRETDVAVTAALPALICSEALSLN
ncbi:hypothetical protein BKA70DRAFT_1239725 [Coprinopsis sp. MPI-PUGE-AT-0042]|nr:hypothetical protein BKA70DRAFT_1239725 [Coprinopsis sp. MPI-PUGE-AT-0042]